MEVQRVHCDERVVANRGRVALIRGPIAYNFEDVDHDVRVNDLTLPPDAPLKAVWKRELLGGVMVVEGQGVVMTDEGAKPVSVMAVPNYVRLNRGGASQVWIVENPKKVEVVHGPDGIVVKPIVRPELDKRTVDRVVIGDPSSEEQHAMKGQGTEAGVFRNMRWRHATAGWFSYELKLKPNAQNRVLCTYWGSDSGNRRFTVSVNGQEIGRQELDNNQPNEFFDVEYAIPVELTEAGGKATVRLSSTGRATAGGIFDLRIVE
jgi:hypothetical protein